jgi:hypothetical protein
MKVQISRASTAIEKVWQMLGCSLGPRLSRRARSSSGAGSGSSTEVVGQGGRSRLRLGEDVAQLDVPAVVEHHAAGLQVARLQLVGLELPASVEHRVQQVPDLDREMRA